MRGHALSVLLLAGSLGCASEPGAPVDAALPALDAASADAGSDAARIDAARSDAGAAYGPAMRLGALPSVLPETSGLVASRAHAGVLWAENDSGNPPNAFAVDETGALLATITLTGATNVDWEDIALAPGASGDDLYLADVGDNAARTSGGTSGRASIRLYRLAEPDPSLGDQSLAAETIELRYPAAPHDCEAVFVDPTTGDAWLVTKEDTGLAHVMVARAPLSTSAPTTLEDVGTLDLVLATAADVRRDRSAVVVRGYGEVRVYDVVGGDFVAALGSPTWTRAPSGAPAEAIAFASNDRDLFTAPEGALAALFRIPAPATP